MDALGLITHLIIVALWRELSRNNERKINMKTPLTLATVFIAASSFSNAEIVVNDFLSFEGFIDMSYSYTDADADGHVSEYGAPLGAASISDSDNSYQIDQVEIDWLFDFNSVTAQLDLNYEGGDAPNDNIVEQAFASYHFDDGSAITAGRYASMLGFEAFEPTGLYQYSFAYGLPQSMNTLTDYVSSAIASGELEIDGVFDFDSALDLALGTVFPLPGYAQGVKYTYESDTSFFGVSVQDGVNGYDDRLGGDSDDGATDGGGYGVELAGAYYMDNGLSFFLGGAYEDGDGYDLGSYETGDTEAWVVNSYVTFETGAWLFAAEVTYGQDEWDEVVDSRLDIDTESLSGMLMANFAYSEKASVTGRFSYVNYELDASVAVSGGGSVDVEAELFKYTLAHNYAFTDNLLLVAEVSYTDGNADASAVGSAGETDISADGDFDELLFAVELLFSF
jgi:hypothetical protein